MTANRGEMLTSVREAESPLTAPLAAPVAAPLTAPLTAPVGPGLSPARAGRLALGFGAAVVVGVLLLALSALLPARLVNANLGADARVLAAEDRAYGWLGDTYYRDSFTDALILSISMIDPAAPVASSLRGSWYDSGNTTAEPSLVERVDRGVGPNATYARYWWGASALWRVVYLLCTYQSWRMLNALLLGIGTVVALLSLWRRGGPRVAVAFALAIPPVVPPLVAGSLQFSPVFYIALIGVTTAASLSAKRDSTTFDLELFMALGIATAYFDLLTAPLLTLGLPLLAILAVRLSSERARARDLWSSSVRAGMSWVIGWLGFWAAKWTINWLTFNPGMWREVAQEFAVRQGQSMSITDRWAVVLGNVFSLIPTWMWPTHPTVWVASLYALAAVVTVALTWGILASWRGLDRARTAAAWPLLAIALTPYAWFMFAAEHSWEHAYFVFRIQALAAVAIALFFAYSIRWSGSRGGRH